MTHDDRFGRTLSAWLAEEAEHRVPDHLAEVLVRTAATRQRPWWSSLERLIPMTTITHAGVAGRRPAMLLLVVVLLLAALAGTALLVGALRSPAPSLPANGRIFLIDAGTVRSFAADGSDPRVEVPAADTLWRVSLSPDGTRLAWLHGPGGTNTVSIKDLATGDTRDIARLWGIGEESLAWSPDGRFLAFQGVDSAGGIDHVHVAAADGSGVTTPGSDAMDPALGIWQPSFSPDGEWIAFLARPKGTEDGIANGDIMVMRRDGSELRRVASNALAPGPAWSPDPAVHRLLYTTADGPALVDVGGNPVSFGTGFWPTWSPDGSRIAFWNDGVRVMTTEQALDGAPVDVATPVGAPFTDTCQSHPELSGMTFCSPVTWSPDGTRLVGADITGSAMLIANADGSGAAVKVPLLMAVSGPEVQPVWQGVRP